MALEFTAAALSGYTALLGNGTAVAQVTDI